MAEVKAKKEKVTFKCKKCGKVLVRTKREKYPESILDCPACGTKASLELFVAPPKEAAKK